MVKNKQTEDYCAAPHIVRLRDQITLAHTVCSLIYQCGSQVCLVQQ